MLSFAVLLAVGRGIYPQAPPIPDRVVDSSGRVVTTGDQIRESQNVWQSMGGMELGSVWGHGSYVAPDWTADYLHRQSQFVLDAWAEREFGAAWGTLDDERRPSSETSLVLAVCRLRGPALGLRFPCSEE